MTTNVDLEKLQKDAVDIFNQGFACSESVIYAIKENFELDMSDDAIAMSSGFPWGLGGGGCICGALAGATMCIGYFFGRKTPGDLQGILWRNMLPCSDKRQREEFSGT